MKIDCSKKEVRPVLRFDLLALGTVFKATYKGNRELYMKIKWDSEGNVWALNLLTNDASKPRQSSLDELSEIEILPNACLKCEG